VELWLAVKDVGLVQIVDIQNVIDERVRRFIDL